MLTVSALIDEALATAVLAPSPYNTQPWHFVVSGDRVDVLLDPARVLTVADPDARQARLSCGAVVFNLGPAAHRARAKAFRPPPQDRRRRSRQRYRCAGFPVRTRCPPASTSSSRCWPRCSPEPVAPG